jgi:phage-related protein
MADILPFWGQVELEPEVAAWLETLPDRSFAQAAFAVDLLARGGATLGEPHTRQLVGKLRELRFYVDRQPYRVSYFIASGRRIILLTVFAKTNRQERSEIERARRTMARCIDQQHTAEDDDE